MEEFSKSGKELYRRIEEYRKEVDSLQKRIEQLKGNQSLIDFNLGKRLKEVNCCNTISDLLCLSGLSVEEACRKIVEVIPAGFQFQEIVKVSLEVNGKVFKTLDFKESSISLTREIKIGTRIAGELRICYPDESISIPGRDFLQEESQMLSSIATWLCQFLER